MMPAPMITVPSLAIVQIQAMSQFVDVQMYIYERDAVMYDVQCHFDQHAKRYAACRCWTDTVMKCGDMPHTACSTPRG